MQIFWIKLKFFNNEPIIRDHFVNEMTSKVYDSDKREEKKMTKWWLQSNFCSEVNLLTRTLWLLAELQANQSENI